MAAAIPATEDPAIPIGVFGFHVSLMVPAANGGRELCRGAFAEASGLEATMEPKVIKVGGRNYGPVQRVGQVSFSTVVLKRGVTTVRDLWTWWSLFTGADTRRDGATSPSSRCNVIISILNPARTPIITWQLENAMPVKFKAGDMNARGTEVAVEELHFVHEGLRVG